MSTITRIADTGNQGEIVDRLALIRMGTLGSSAPWPFFHVTAVRVSSSGRLVLILWKTDEDGTITRVSDSGDQAGEVDLVAGISGVGNTLVTAVRGTQSGQLKLILWNVPPGGDVIERVSDSGGQAGQVDEIRITRGGSSSRLVTAVRSATSDRLRLINWGVSGPAITRLGSDDHAVGQIDLLALGRVSGPFGGPAWVTGVRGRNSQRHKLIAWKIDDEKVERIADSGKQVGDISVIAPEVFTEELGTFLVGTPAITAVQGDAGHLRLIGWGIEFGPETHIHRRADSGDQAGAIDLVDFASAKGSTGKPNLVTAVRSSATGRLKVIHWQWREDPPPGNPIQSFKYDFQRLGDSGSQAGAVDLLAIDGGTFGYPLWTAVKGTASQRVKLITWAIEPE